MVETSRDRAPLRLHVLSRREIERGESPIGWDDPDGIARIEPPKVRTLLENPSNGPDSEPAQIIGTSGDRVVGRLDLVPGVVRVEGTDQRIYFGSSLYVPESHRNTLMGVMLILKCQAIHHTVAAFGVSQVARLVYEKLKWSSLELPRFVLIRRSRPVVRRYWGERPGLGIVSRIADGMLATHRHLARIATGGRLRRFQWTRVDAFPIDLEHLLQGAPQPVACHRSRAWLHWLLTNSFREDARDGRALFLISGLGGRVIGYFLLKIRFYESATHREFKQVLLGSLQDWMIFDPASIDFLDIVLIAIRELSRLDVDAIEVLPVPPESGRGLRRLGFARVGSMYLMFRAVSPSQLAGPVARPVENWFVRPGDGENFFA